MFMEKNKYLLQRSISNIFYDSYTQNNNYSMNSFPLQKKNLINSRMLDTNKLHTTDNFEQIVQKQLNDDFKVHEYLTENQTQENNTEKYMSLLNKLLVQKREKTKTKQYLLNNNPHPHTFNTSQISQNGQHVYNIEQMPKDTYYSEQEYLKIMEESQAQQEIIQIKTREELEMRNILWKEINQKKKSLNLLKGDIGHMITRNQSISVLQSKVNKVKLVSQHQQKRVSMALCKDKEEVQLRQIMQKKFHNKLVTFGGSQSRNLKRNKAYYIEMMNRRKQIFDKLGKIEQQCASIELYSDKQKQFQQNNLKTLSKFSLLSYLCNIIDNAPQISQKFHKKQISHKQYCQQMQKQFNSIFTNSSNNNNSTMTKRTTNPDCWQTECNQFSIQTKSIFYHIQDVRSELLEEFMSKIKEQYNLITYQIEEKKKVYNQLMKELEGLRLRNNKVMREEMEVRVGFVEEEREKVEEMYRRNGMYYDLLKELQRNYQMIYLIIQFISKRIPNFTGTFYISKLYANYIYHYSMMTQNSPLQPQQQQAISNNHPIISSKSLHIPSSSTQKQKQTQKITIFTELQQQLIKWFNQIMIQITKKQATQQTYTQQNKNDKQIQNYIYDVIKNWKNGTENMTNMHQQESNKQIETPMQSQENQYQKNGRNNTNVVDYADGNNKEDGLYQNTLTGQVLLELYRNCKKSIRPSYTGHGTHKDLAKRVQLLQNIDQRYYKMIKDTLEMEKQNTRKNYEFRKNFKRTKYSTQDQLLEQKRFQSTFSTLFKQDEDNSTVRSRKTPEHHTQSNTKQIKGINNVKIKQLGALKPNTCNTFHTRSSMLLKKSKQEYLDKIAKSKEEWMTKWGNKTEENYKENKRDIQGKHKTGHHYSTTVHTENNRKQGKTPTIKIRESQKNLHLKLKDVINLI